MKLPGLTEFSWRDAGKEARLFLIDIQIGRAHV